MLNYGEAQRKKVSYSEGVESGEPRRSRRLSAKPAVEMKPEGQETINVQTKKVHQGERGAKGVVHQETKDGFPVENRETKNEESPASEEAGEKEAKFD
ncbi:non-histone chromosomal protein HMG-14-like [Neomonachus schauinslandi]|uniref:Non-histone chromosomal protein HMG-14-like n=1 Tax=Neomonachus schauinslandi TaxID=29088 RepID=A0A8M1MC40_NEOSC|nr:non-histone chromosomal protein HMG-14-like [Neomonachus schauinslandi]